MTSFTFRHRYGCGLVEDRGYLGIHLDHVVALHGNPLIASVDLGVDPVGEVRSHDRMDDVSQVRPAELGDLFRRRKSPFDLLVILGEVEDVLNGQAFELGNDNDFNIITWDDALHPHCKVSKVPDGHRLVAGKVGPHLR